jgi:hypothetical protein
MPLPPGAMRTCLRDLFAPLANSSESQQRRPQNPSHTYAGNRFTVRVTATAASRRREARPYRAI